MPIEHIHNVTDVTEAPGRRLKLFGVQILPGGVLRIPSERLDTRPVQDRLARLAAAKLIHVGAVLPAWYLQAKQVARDQRKSAQAYRPRPRLQQAVAPSPEPAPAPAAERTAVPANLLHQELRKRGKSAAVGFIEYFSLPVEATTRMGWKRLLAAVDAGLEEVAVADEDLLSFFEE